MFSLKLYLTLELYVELTENKGGKQFTCRGDRTQAAEPSLGAD